MEQNTISILFVTRNFHEFKKFDQIVQDENLGYKTDYADCFKSGLEVLSRNQIHCIISDHVLPDGIATNFFEYDKNLKIIYLINSKINRFDYSQVDHTRERYLNKDVYGNYLALLPVLIDQLRQINREFPTNLAHKKFPSYHEDMRMDEGKLVPGVLVLDEKFQVDSANEEFKELFQIKTLHYGKRVHSEWEEIVRQVKCGKIPYYEGPLTWADGGPEVLVKIKVTELAGNKLSRYVLFLFNITAMKVAKIAKEYSEERYKLLIENFPEGMALKQYNRFYYVNKVGKNILGLKLTDDFPGILADGIIPETSIANKIHRTEAEKFEYWTDLNGELKQIFVRVIPIQFFDQDAQLVVFRDVEESRDFQNKLAQLASVVEQATDSIIITDLQGNILYVNPAFERTSLYSRSEVLGKNPRILKSGKQPDAFYTDMWKTISSGRIWKGNIINKNREGDLYIEDVTIFPVKDSTGEMMNYAAVKKDITSEKMLQEELVQSQKLEAIGQLAGGVAHDFNNMLTAISGFAELGLLQTENGSKLHRNLSEIYKASERAAELTRQLLAFSRKQEIKPALIQVNNVLSDLTKMLERLIGEHIELKLILGKNLPEIKADKGQLEQLLINLVVNARDAIRENSQFSGDHKIIIETGVTDLDKTFTASHLGSHVGKHIQLNISDTGIGIPKDIINKIFEPFFTTKKAGAGTGLGLSTVYGIVKQNNGSIFVYSEKNKGTIFKIYWPVEENPEIVSEELNKKKELLKGNEKILVVEDDENVRAFVEDSLRTLGYNVEMAPNGLEAWEKFKQKKNEFDLVFTDIVMPKMTGKELSEEIKRIKPDMKFLFASGYTAGYFSKSNVLEPGIEFIQKPYSIQDVAQKIRRILERD